jgi:sugar lactone lactonase YvrE
MQLLRTGPTYFGSEREFPVEPIKFVDEPFRSCEGIGFNGEGGMFVTCNQALWQVSKDGSATEIVELDSNLGVAGIGSRDLLVADFGPTNAFRHDRNTDGIVWRISPEGEKTAHATGIGDPNFILVREDGSYLVTDDATADIYVVEPDGTVALYTTAVNHPNGIVLSLDGSVLYVAQMFSNIRPVVGVSKIWALRLQDGKPYKDAKLVAETGPQAFVDGLAMDARGRVYIAANREGRIWRYDPGLDELIIIAEGVFGAASIAFGEGDFDRQSIYVTTTFSAGRGGIIWQIPVGIKGAPLFR